MGFERKDVAIEKRPSDEFQPALRSSTSTEPEFRRVEVDRHEPHIFKDERNLVNTDINAPENALDASDFKPEPVFVERLDFPSNERSERRQTELERERNQMARDDLRSQESPPTDNERRDLERLDISETAQQRDGRTFGDRVHDMWESTKNTFMHPTEEREREREREREERQERSSDETPSLWERAKQTFATTEDRIERAIKPESEKTFMEKWRDHKDENEEREKRELERERDIIREDGISNRFENRVERPEQRPTTPESGRTFVEKWRDEKEVITEKIENVFRPERQLTETEFEERERQRLDNTEDKKLVERW